jgi:hypothetical protein
MEELAMSGTVKAPANKNKKKEQNAKDNEKYFNKMDFGILKELVSFCDREDAINGPEGPRTRDMTLADLVRKKAAEHTKNSTKEEKQSKTEVTPDTRDRKSGSEAKSTKDCQ